ncbi:unnamed protein product [Lupinus luteus]|uniref:Uncharacterized protein n=1 Tax=Lupinus luteus TaxID=3873 RepID=A0AAV1XP98_LUPLU
MLQSPGHSPLHLSSPFESLIPHLLFAEEVSDFNRLVIIADASIDWQMSIHEPHLITVTLSDTGDEILDMAEGGADGGGGFPGTKPSIDLQLLLPILVGNEIKIEVQMLKTTNNVDPQLR